MLRRELYTNSDVAVLAFRRVIASTGIDPGLLAADLADRMLTMELVGDDIRVTDGMARSCPNPASRPDGYCRISRR